MTDQLAENYDSSDTSHRDPNRPLALLFDLDGTLADSVELIVGAYRHAFAAHMSGNPNDEQWISGMGTPLMGQIRKVVGDDALVDPFLATYREFQQRNHDRLLREFEGVRETLELLHGRGHPTAVVTSKANEGARRAMRLLQLEPYIDELVGLDSCERHKPNPEPVLLALELLGYSPSEAVFLGDSPHDIRAGNAAGVTTVAALWGPFPRAVLEAASPDYLIEHIREFPALIAAVQSAR
ncbi:MAG TPA: HAD-IA family hydrolase [Gemmatimonadaceae bacterium]|jgi:pyrophosphatase PpaX|nr:HAD-IA family hydrolase [Gemmatimonadaceae bacterium]